MRIHCNILSSGSATPTDPALNEKCFGAEPSPVGAVYTREQNPAAPSQYTVQLTLWKMIHQPGSPRMPRANLRTRCPLCGAVRCVEYRAAAAADAARQPVVAKRQVGGGPEVCCAPAAFAGPGCGQR